MMKDWLQEGRIRKVDTPRSFPVVQGQLGDTRTAPDRTILWVDWILPADDFPLFDGVRPLIPGGKYTKPSRTNWHSRHFVLHLIDRLSSMFPTLKFAVLTPLLTAKAALSAEARR